MMAGTGIGEGEEGQRKLLILDTFLGMLRTAAYKNKKDTIRNNDQETPQGFKAGSDR